MEKWNELCFILSESIPVNASEQVFEIKVIQAFEKLGWSQFKNEIVVRKSIQLGASNKIIPDLVIQSKDKGNPFVVEVKKPSLDINNSNFKGQLSSFMAIMRVNLGILIGNKIQIFVDGRFFNKNNIILIDEIEFKRNNEKGLKFVRLFSKESYNIDCIEKHAQQKIQKLKELEAFKKLKNRLLSNHYHEKINDYLRTVLLEEFEEKTIENVFKILEVKIENKNNQISSRNHELLNSKKYISIDTTNSSGKLPIGKYVQKTFQELISNNLIDTKEIERLQRKDYSKITFDLQFPFLAKESSIYYERIRYWTKPYYINGEIYFACSQWYEVPANNDRPYYEKWLRKMRS